MKMLHPAIQKMVILPLIIVALLVQACSPTSTAPITLPTTPPTSTATPPTLTPPTLAPSPTATALPTATQAAPIPPTGPLSRTALVEALRGGGYVIYFRHAATIPTPDDANPVVLDDCTTQRNLSPAGQEQARAIGQAFRRLGIPVGKVLSSPFCRALDTARLAFGQAEIDPLLENLETSPDDAEREKRIAGLRRLLAAPPDPGTNTVLVAHGFNLSSTTQATVPEGGAAVFRPDGAGGFEQVATVPPEEWATLQSSK